MKTYYACTCIVEGQRSRSSSPTSNDLSSYLPADISSFLKHDNISTTAYDSESLKHSGSIDKETIAIDESKSNLDNPTVIVCHLWLYVYVCNKLCSS